MVTFDSRDNWQLPRVSGTIDRKPLLETLETAAEHRLTLITAPPGYGKTTLAAQFAQQSRTPVIWHTVEERERDLPNLYRACLTAFRNFAPTIEMPQVTPGSTAEELAALLTAQIRDKLTQHVIFILDDVQNLADSPQSEVWLRAFVRTAPPKCHLMLVSRIIPDLPLTEMIARREVLAIGQKDLRFNVDEVERLARRINAHNETRDRLHRITERLEGWPAGIILALQPLPQELESAALPDADSGPEALFNSLAGLMLRAQPVQLREFLLRSSTLNRLTPELCANVLGMTDSVRWLDEAQKRGLFLAKTVGGLAYHSLFRNFLQREFFQTEPEQYAELHDRAAQWFKRHDQLETALEHYIAVDDSESAAAIAEQVAQLYHSQGNSETLLRWGRQLHAIGAEAPRLEYSCAMIYTDRYEYELATAHLERAQLGFAQRGDNAGLVSVAIQHAMIALQQGQLRDAVTQAIDIIDNHILPPNLRARALSILGYAQLRLGDIEPAIRHLEEAVPLYRDDGDAYALSQALQDLNVAYMQVGRLDDAGTCLQEIVALCRSLGSASALAIALNNLGYYYHLRSDYQQAGTTFQEGLNIATRILDRRAETYLLWSLGDLQRDCGAYDLALKLYEKGLKLSEGSEPVVHTALLLSVATLRRWRGEYDEALHCANQAHQLAVQHDIALDRTMAQVLVWAIQAQRGQYDVINERLSQAAADLNRQGANFELLRLLALRANLSLLRGKPQAAREYLKAAVAVAHETKSLQPFVAEVYHLPTLHDYVTRQAGLRDATFEENLQALQQAQQQVARRQRRQQPAAQLTFTMRVQTFGREVIEREGQLVQPSHWRTAAARELFLYLLFVGPQNRGDLYLHFWPDSPTTKARSNFHTTLHRARRALGRNVILYQDGLYTVDDELDLYCDALQLEKLTERARLMPTRDARTEDLWHRAVQLYNGDFLPTMDASWVLPLRERYRDLYIEALIGLSDCADARGEVPAALAALRRAAALEPYREDIHRRIMQCYARKGEPKKVKDQYNNLQQLLWNDLAVKPSAETEQFAHLLLR